MALLFRVMEATNRLPNAKNPTYATARAKQLGQVSTKDLAASISNRCTLHRSDVLAVLDALSEVAIEYLLMGYGVKVGELGSFYTTLKSKSTLTKEEFDATRVQRANIRFTPGVDLKAKLQTASFMDINDYVALRKKKGVEDAGDSTNSEVPITPGVGGDEDGGFI